MSDIGYDVACGPILSESLMPIVNYFIIFQVTENVLVNNHFHYFGENRGDRNRSAIGDLR